MPNAAQFDGGRELAIVEQESPLLGSLLRRTFDAINRFSRNSGVGINGEYPAPPPIDSISVAGTLSNNVLTVPGEILHFAHTHNSPLQRGIRYITEIDTNPSFSNPHQVLESSSRSGFVHLPTNNSSSALVNYYLRAVTQYPGSAPSRPTVYGGLQGPTAINFSGSTNLSLLTSQSGGTAKPYQGGQGLGAVQARGPVGGPKRQLTS